MLRVALKSQVRDLAGKLKLRVVFKQEEEKEKIFFYDGDNLLNVIDDYYTSAIKTALEWLENRTKDNESTSAS